MEKPPPLLLPAPEPAADAEVPTALIAIVEWLMEHEEPLLGIGQHAVVPYPAGVYAVAVLLRVLMTDADKDSEGAAAVRGTAAVLVTGVLSGQLTAWRDVDGLLVLAPIGGPDVTYTLGAPLANDAGDPIGVWTVNPNAVPAAQRGQCFTLAELQKSTTP